MKIYKIGDFAVKIGVTPDFLKYYEKEGIISNNPETNTRTYSFDKSMRILECLRLRNLGYNVKEIEKLLLNADYEEIKESLELKIEEKSRETTKENYYLDELKCVKEWMNLYEDDPQPYAIEQMDEQIFLPHSDKYDFIENDQIYAILNSWVENFPVVHSCRKFVLGKDGNVEQMQWGLMVSKKAAEALNIEINDACETIPKQKTFSYAFIQKTINEENKAINFFMDKASQMHLKCSKNVYDEVYFYTKTNSDEAKRTSKMHVAIIK